MKLGGKLELAAAVVSGIWAARRLEHEEGRTDAAGGEGRRKGATFEGLGNEFLLLILVRMYLCIDCVRFNY